METATIYKMINEHLEKLDVPYQKDPGYDYLKQITSSYKITNLDGFLKSDIYEVYKGIFYLEHNREFSIDDVCEKVDIFRNLFDSIEDSISIDTFKSFCNTVLSYGSIDSAIEYLSEDSTIKSKLLEMKYQNENIHQKVLFSMKLIKGHYSKQLPKLVECLKIIKENPNMMEMFDYVLGFYEILSCIAGVKYAEYVVKELKGQAAKDCRSAINNFITKTPLAKKIPVQLKSIIDFVHKEEQEERKTNKSRINEIYSLKNALVLFNNAIKKDEIVNAREITKGACNVEIKYAMLQYIYDHNKKYYDMLDERISQLENNSIVQYSKLLENFSIDVEGIDINKIMHNGLDEVETMLKMLRNKMFSDDMIIYILSYSNYSKFMEIMDYVSKSYLSSEYLKFNLSIFTSESNTFEYFKNNFNYLNDIGINPQLFYGQSYLLFNENGIFKKNIDLLKEYDLLKYLKTTDAYDFLLENDLVSKIDMLIEFGYVDLLKHDLGLLNYSSYGRLYVMRMLSEKIETKEELANILDSSKRFFVPDSKISKDFSSDNLLDKYDDWEDIKVNLEEYRTTSRTYDIGGNILSSNRIDRNLAEGSNIFQAIVKDSALLKEDFDEIFDSLKQNNK